MYWVGLGIAAAGGLLGINLIRRKIQFYYPKINDSFLDKILITLVIIGLSITTMNFLVDQSNLENLNNEVDLLKYEEVSIYNATGNKSAKVNGVPIVRTTIDDWDKKFILRKDGKLLIKCDSSAINACIKVINKVPSYPFAYYFLAVCQKINGNELWKKNAEQAKLIFDKTVTFPNHHPDHDLILKDVNELLKN
jgi:hypothetical protein